MIIDISRFVGEFLTQDTSDRRGARGLEPPDVLLEPDSLRYPVESGPTRAAKRPIDRKLQKAPVVYCRYFLYENREEDTILRRIVERRETIYRELGGFRHRARQGADPDATPPRHRACPGDRDRPDVRLSRPRTPEERAATARAEVAGDDEEGAEVEAGDKEGGPAVQVDESRAGRPPTPGKDRARASNRSVRSWSGARPGSPSANRSSGPRLDCSLRLLDIEGGLSPETLERPRARCYFFPTDWRSNETRPGVRPSIASAHPGIGARTLAHGTRGARSGRSCSRIPGRSPSV